jgi:hypothetical protein
MYLSLADHLSLIDHLSRELRTRNQQYFFVQNVWLSYHVSYLWLEHKIDVTCIICFSLCIFYLKELHLHSNKLYMEYRNVLNFYMIM